MGPEVAKSFPGRELVNGLVRPAERAKQACDYDHRGKGSVFGALRPATGEAFTACYDRRTIVNWVDFLERVDAWIPAEAEQGYAIMDNLRCHRSADALLFSLSHPRWVFVFQPTYAAYLNLIEPWWKVLRSLALQGRVFQTWQEVVAAIEAAPAYWNGHRHPFVWGRRRRHRSPRRHPGVGGVPSVS